MFFDEEFVRRAEEKPFEAIVDACERAFEHLEMIANGSNQWTSEDHEFLWEVTSFIQLIIENQKINIEPNLPEPSGVANDDCPKLTAYLNQILEVFKKQTLKLKIADYKSRYTSLLRSSFAYEFSQGDLDRIQVLINELRNHITDCKEFEDGHKRRLLKRLECLQLEIHKRVSDLDKFWGLIGDGGVVLGKLGNDAKPIVDRIKEIAEIVWKTQARTEELPSQSNNPMLENEEDK